MRGLVLLLLVSCETMESPGSPLDPVEVTAVSADTPGPSMNPELGETAGAEPALDSTSTASVPEAIEEPVEEVRSPDPDVSSADPVETPSGDEGLAETAGPPVNESETVLEDLEACLVPKPGSYPEMDISGSIRLRRISMDQGRPLAWVELPDGSAVMAQVGSMFPSLGLVVMSIGEQQIQVAQISPSVHGDEATLLLQTLRSQD